MQPNLKDKFRVISIINKKYDKISMNLISHVPYFERSSLISTLDAQTELISIEKSFGSPLWLSSKCL